MSYKPNYTGGWKSGVSGGTPITPEALNHMESGIETANEHLLPDPQVADNATFLRNDDTWQKVTPANIGAVPIGFASAAVDAIMFYKSNGMVYVTVPARYCNIGSVTIPDGYRPAIDTDVPGIFMDKEYNIRLACVSFRPNGSIVVQTGRCETLNSSSGFFCVSCCYPAA